jgi:hypothetical protein
MSQTRTTQILEEMLGNFGAEVITDTVAHTPEGGKVYTAIAILDDAIFHTLTGNLTGNQITGILIPESFYIYGRFTNIRLTSGACIAYKGV